LTILVVTEIVWDREGGLRGMRFFSTGDPQAFHRLSDRVSELEREVLKLQSTLKLSKSEWDDTLDKILKQVERMRKRSQISLEDDRQGRENAADVSRDPNYRQTLLGQIYGGKR